MKVFVRACDASGLAVSEQKTERPFTSSAVVHVEVAGKPHKPSPWESPVGRSSMFWTDIKRFQPELYDQPGGVIDIKIRIVKADAMDVLLTIG